MATLTQYDNGGDYTPEQIEAIYDSVELVSLSPTLIHFKATLADYESNIYGSGFAFDAYGNPTGGRVTGLDERLNGSPLYTISGLSMSLGTFINLSQQGRAFDEAIFAGADILNGAPTYGDLLIGFAGDDMINGYGGNDWLDGGTGSDKMTGGSGDDVYVVDATGDTVVEEADGGIDVVISSITYTLSDTLEHLSLGGGAKINGFGNASKNFIEGNRNANLLFGYEAGDELAGQEGDDRLDGGAGNDALDGGDGNDTLEGGLGADRMSGGNGADTYLVDSIKDKVTEDAGGYGRDLVKSSVTFTLSAELEDLTLTGTLAINGTGNDADNTIIGNDAANDLFGGGGDDDIYGGGGDDKLHGGGGVNTLYGGAGDDTYYESVNIREEEDEGIDTLVVSGSSHFILDQNVENLVLIGGAVSWTGNALDNTITGNDLDNVLSGHFGSDTIYGAGGNDLLFANGSTLYGGVGDDRYIGSFNVIVEEAGQGIDYVQSEATHVLGDNVENLGVGLFYFGNVDGTGNALNNIITAGGGNNRLDGGAGDDVLTGGMGDDTYVVDSARDVLQEKNKAGLDLVLSSATWTLADYVENLTLTGAGTIKGTGNKAANILLGNDVTNSLSGLGGNDSLEGAGGNDALLGGDGNDTLLGGIGSDTLTGGGGRDYFTFDLGEGALGRDRVLDFTDGLDKLKLIGSATSYSEFLANGGSVVVRGADTLVYFSTDQDDYVRLVGVGAAIIGKGDFLFA